jgi:recombination protein RecA
MAKKTKKPLSLAERRKKIRDRYEKPVVIYEEDNRMTIPTRFPALNHLLGGGVIPGAIIEEFGFEDSAKSSLSIAIAADVQKYWKAQGSDKTHVVIVNYEGPEPWGWWRTLGLDTSPDSFTQLRPRSLEEGMADMIDLVESGEVCCVIIDSVYAAGAKDSKNIVEDWRNPKKSGQAGGGGMAVEARQWGKAWTAFKGVFMDQEVVVIAVNQMREKIDQAGPPRAGWMGKPTTTPRGHALKFYAWVRLELKGTNARDLPQGVDGRLVKIKVVKNKTTDESRGRCEYTLIRGKGFDLTNDLIDLGLRNGFIDNKGAGRFVIQGHKVHGRESLIEYLDSNEEAMEALRKSAVEFLSSEED